MASRITSGARLCVRASIDRLVCNLSRNRHHNAVTTGVETAAVRRSSDRLLQCYQVSTVLGAGPPSDGRVRSAVFQSFSPVLLFFFSSLPETFTQGPLNDFAVRGFFFFFGKIPCQDFIQSVCQYTIKLTYTQTLQLDNHLLFGPVDISSSCALNVLHL